MTDIFLNKVKVIDNLSEKWSRCTTPSLFNKAFVDLPTKPEEEISRNQTCWFRAKLNLNRGVDAANILIFNRFSTKIYFMYNDLNWQNAKIYCSMSLRLQKSYINLSLLIWIPDKNIQNEKFQQISLIFQHKFVIRKLFQIIL